MTVPTWSTPRANAGLPRRRDVIGRKIVGHSGKMYGHIHDVMVDPTNGRILSYALDDSAPGGLDGTWGYSEHRQAPSTWVAQGSPAQAGPTVAPPASQEPFGEGR